VPDCVLKEGDIFVNWDKSKANTAFVPKSWPERVEIQHAID